MALNYIKGWVHVVQTLTFNHISYPTNRSPIADVDYAIIGNLGLVWRVAYG